MRLVVSSAESLGKVEEYVSKRKLRFPVLHDPKGVCAKAWGLGGIAYGVVLGAHGRVVWQGRIGPQGDADGCEAAILRELELRGGTKGALPR